jgi:hypothetical protein
METKPVQTVTIREGQTELERKAAWQRRAARDSARAPMFDQMNEPPFGRTAPTRRHEKGVRRRGSPLGSTEESIVQNDPEDLPRPVHVVVGLLVITIACAFVALAIRCNAL